MWAGSSTTNREACGVIELIVATVIGLIGQYASPGHLRADRATRRSAGAAHATRQQAESRFILVTVTDTGGRSIIDLDPDDFVVRETGEPRDVLSIRAADYPIVLVLDNGPGANRDFDAIRTATRRFIARVGRRPIAIASANPPGMVATFDDDRATVIQRVDKLRKGGSGDGLFQAVATAAQAIQKTGTAFSGVVVVAANSGGTVPAELHTSILDSGANIHAVVVQQKTSAGGGNQARRQSLEMLMALADETHGQLTTIYAPDAYQLAFDRFANQLAGELILEYIVPAGSSKGSDVRLGVRLAGAKIDNWSLSRR